MKKEDLLDSKLVIGMIHVDALPGTPKYGGNVNQIIENAIEEALIFKSSGIEGIMIENMHDVPYLNNAAGPEITSTMAIIAYEIKRETNLFTGVQILAAANEEALAVAHAANLDFIRAEGFVFAHVADEGVIESNAGTLLRYKKQIGADNVMVFTDVKKKHSSHSLTSDVSIVGTAKAAEFFLSDGIVITGSSTGVEVDISELNYVKQNSNLPVIIGSGVTSENIPYYYKLADIFIVGSYFKEDGDWKNKVDKERVEKLLSVVEQCKIKN
ncbi:MAG: BtpA/SgcQ family protein [Melioribacteraceae bacterium]|nr:BtpA/SgcQ family protein [Melioribacteraceae bacterium]